MACHGKIQRFSRLENFTFIFMIFYSRLIWFYLYRVKYYSACSLFFCSPRHFGHFCWDVLVTETFRPFVSQLYQNSPQQCSLAYIFRQSDRNDLIFFGHFKSILVYARKTTEQKQAGNFNVVWVLQLMSCKSFIGTFSPDSCTSWLSDSRLNSTAKTREKSQTAPVMLLKK